MKQLLSGWYQPRSCPQTATLQFLSAAFHIQSSCVARTAWSALLFNHTSGGKQVGVTQFVGVFAEVAHLDPAFFHQGLQTEIDGGDIDAHFFGQRALSHARVFLEHFKRPKQGVVIGSLAASGHRARSVWQVLGSENE